MRGFRNQLFQSDAPEKVAEDDGMFKMTELGQTPTSDAIPKERTFYERYGDSKLGKFFKEFRVVTLALLYAFFTSLTICLAKMAYTLIESENLIIRYVVQIAVMISIIVHQKHKIKRQRSEVKWIVIRSAFGVGEVIVNFFAIKLLDPGNFTTLSNISMITTAFIARFLLKEKVSSIHFVASVLAFAGIICIVRPPFLFGSEDSISVENNTTPASQIVFSEPTKPAETTQNTTLGVLLVILAAIFLSFEIISNKKLANMKLHYSLVLFYPSLIGLPCGIILTAVLFATNKAHQNFKDESHLLAIHITYSFISAISSVVSNIFLNLAIKTGDATKISILRTTSVLFSIFIELLLLGIKIHTLDAIGTILIMTAILGIIIYQYIEKKLNIASDTLKNKNKFLACLFRKI